MADPRRIYRLLLKLYPPRFREQYEAPMERQFWDEYREAHGVRGRSVYWMAVLADLALAIPAEILRELRQDMLYAGRVYRRRRTVTALALVALALAIGATTGVFSVLNALLLRSLPFRDPERLVEVRNPGRNPLSGPSAFHAWYRGSGYLEDAAPYYTSMMNMTFGQGAVRVKVTKTSWNFFRTLGTEPELGRGFAEGEDVKGRDSLAVIGYGLWQQEFGGDPRVLGTAIRLGGVPITVIGVAPPGMDFPARTTVWTPATFDLDLLPVTDPFIAWDTIGRLKPGLSLARAAAMLDAEANREARGRERESASTLVPLREQLAGRVRQASTVLMGIVAFVLLIACANVAHLLLSRISERRHELLVRAALGASRARLVQQLITESTLMTLVAAAGGLGVAHVAARLASAVEPAALATQQYTVLDWRVLAFAVGVAALTGLLFGVLPAGLIARMQTSEDLVRSQPNAHGAGVRRMRNALLAAEAALTVMLLAGSLTMIRSFTRLLRTDLGFRTGRVITLSVSLAGSRRETGGRQAQYYREVLDRLRAVPGVESAGATAFLPLNQPGLAIFGVQLDSSPKPLKATINHATPDYFRSMGTPIVEGRDFASSDRPGAESVAIVNEEFARTAGNPRGLVGSKLRMSPRGKEQYTIVGVARSARIFGPAREAYPQVFFPVDQRPMDFVTFVARVPGKTGPYLAICRDVVRQVDPQIPAYDVKTLDTLLDQTLARPRFYTTTMVFFGGFALLLSVIGIYGVSSFSIVQRTHEIGVRLAVGASAGRMRAMLLRQSLVPVVAGTALGVAGAAASGSLLERLVFGAATVGVTGCAAAAAVLAATSSLAIWRAGRRIAQMDPMRVLRAE